MDDTLIVYVFRTIICRPKGLRLKLTVRSVSNNIIMFDEQQNPGASIFSCGLFLAAPTLDGVKDPVLLGVLNQVELQDQEPQTEFGVFWASHRIPATLEDPADPIDEVIESFLGKRKPLTGEVSTEIEYFWMKQNVSLIKNGIIKNLPHSTIFDCIVGSYLKQNLKFLQFSNFCTQTTPNMYASVVDVQKNSDEGISYANWVPSIPEPRNPTHIFLSFMQNLLNTHKSISTPPTSSKIQAELDGEVAAWEANKENVPPRLSLSTLTTIGQILEGKHTTLVYFKGFLVPNSPNDLAEYEALVRMAQDNINALASAVLNVLIEPFRKTLARMSLLESGYPRKSLPKSCAGIQTAKTTLEKLIRFSTHPFSEISEQELTEQLPNLAGLSEIVVFRVISNCLELPQFARAFFRQVEQKLKEYPETYKNMENVDEYLATRPSLPKGSLRMFQGLYITDNFTRVGDQFLLGVHESKDCVTRSAKSDTSVRFSGGFKTHHAYRIQAIICKGETKVCIINERIPEKEKPLQSDESDLFGDSITRIRVFHHEHLAATFELGPAHGMEGSKCAARTLQHFTGRYLVRFERSDDAGRSEIAVLDLATCFQVPPSAPIMRSKILESFLKEDSFVPFAYACTDKFLSYMAINVNEVGEHGELIGMPIILGIIRYDTEEGLTAIPAISCAEHFEHITKDMSPDVVYTESDSSSQICWSKDISKVFYVHYVFEEDSLHDKTLFIACFGVSQPLNSLKTVAFNCFQLNHLMRDSLFKKRKPVFRTLATRTKEYLVMDLMLPLDWGGASAKQPEKVFGRALFAVHKHKLHWVLVNGDPIYSFPERIGNEVGYPGYVTTSISLFHRRRVFSANRVVYALSRLCYKPL